MEDDSQTTKLTGQLVDNLLDTATKFAVAQIAPWAASFKEINRTASFDVKNEPDKFSELKKNEKSKIPDIILEEDMLDTSIWFDYPKEKPKRPSGAQRKKAIKAKLAERGEIFDPSKFRPVYTAKKAAQQNQNSGLKRKYSEEFLYEPDKLYEKPGDISTPGTSKYKPENLAVTGDLKENFKSAQTNIKIAVIPEGYPAVRFTKEQKELLQSAFINEISNLEDGECARLAGSYTENDALILSCLNRRTADWIISRTPELTPWEGAKLVAGNKTDLLPLTKVVLKIPKQLTSKDPSQIMALLEKQNPSLGIASWKTISSKKEYNSWTLVFLVNDESLRAIKDGGNHACLALWQVYLITLEGDNPKGSSMRLSYSREAHGF